MSIKIASMNFGDCDTILHNTPNGMKNIAEVLGPNGEVYWTSTKELTGVPPLSIKSNGTPLLDYLISGNMSQSGTPTPDNPIQPQETGERTGNLFDVFAYSSYTTGISNIVTTSNSITYTAASVFLAIRYFFPLNATDIFTVQLGSESSKVRLELRYRKNGSTVGDTIVVTIGNSYVIRGSEDVDEIQISISNGTSTGTCKASNIMLNLGSEALPYEPYGYKLTISSAGKTNNIYLGEVQTTRRIKKLVLTGKETNWSATYWSNSFVFYDTIATTLPQPVSDIGICSHFKQRYGNILSPGEFNVRFTPENNRIVIGFGKSEFANINDFKAYLAQQYATGTPVTIWYILATPETVTINEPIRKIGDYADTLSYEQAGAQIPTNKGNTVIDVLTTLKPSQMYIKYK